MCRPLLKHVLTCFDMSSPNNRLHTHSDTHIIYILFIYIYISSVPLAQKLYCHGCRLRQLDDAQRLVFCGSFQNDLRVGLAQVFDEYGGCFLAGC